MSVKRLIKYSFLSIGLLSIVGLAVFQDWVDRQGMTSKPINANVLRRARKAVPIQRPATIDRVANAIKEVQPDEQAFDLERFLERQKNSVTFTKEELEKFVEQNHQDAGSLLTSFQASQNTAFLQRAAQKYPSDASVQLAVLMHRAYPELRRKWIDLYMQSAPKNAFACYLSALDRFESGNVEAAITDLMEATQRSRFRHDGYDYILSVFELLQSAGKDSTEARLAVIADIPLPHLYEVKQLSVEVIGLMGQYRKMDDTNSFNAAGYVCFKLASRLNEGMDAYWIAAQQIRIDIESHLFRLYDPTESPPFLRATVRERLTALEIQYKALNDMEQLIKSRLVTATDEERATYVVRVLDQGQLGAIRWLKP